MNPAGTGNDIEDPKMPLIEHLRELRRRLIYTFIGVGIAFVITWNFSFQILDFIKDPLLAHLPEDLAGGGAKKLHYDTLISPFFTHLKAAFYAAVFVTLPFTIFQIWRFVAPGLYGKEKNVAWPFLLLSYPLFILGASFFYLVVLQFMLKFFINFDTTLEPSLRIGEYLSLNMQLIFVFGLIFELPLLSLLLTRMGMLTPEFMTKNRRYAFLGTFVVGAILTPADPISQVALAVPLY
ncbi:MAG: twin-arginine translocase subunit TatC, partial [bacterium]